MNYKETLEYMFSKLPMYQRTGKAAYKANLDNTIALDEYFNKPHKKFKSIHIAGTNGKGSVSHAIASVLQSSGLKVGLYTSPHLRDFRERIKINGQMLPEVEVVNFVSKHKKKFEELCPSFFEMTVALAFDYFARMKVDIAVIEVGLGGRLDSTNIITPLVSVITNISKDHTMLLGDGPDQIAREKAGIIKKGIPVVISEKQKEVAGIFTDITGKNKTPLIFAEDHFALLDSKLTDGKQIIRIKQLKRSIEHSIKCDLLGNYQQRNIRAAMCAIEELNNCGFSISNKNIQDGLSKIVSQTGLLGRWQILRHKPLVICDTAHNIAGITEIVKQINTTDYRNLHIVFGMVDDKNVDQILNLMPKNATYYFTKAQIPRAMDERLLTDKGQQMGLSGNSYSTVPLALKAAMANSRENDLVFVGGSTFVVAEVI